MNKDMPNRLNDAFFGKRPDVEFRVWGFHFDKRPCDLSFLPHMPNVQRFSADCLDHATGIEHIAALPNLQKLGLGIRDLESFSVLDHISSSLTDLSLTATKSKRPHIEHLRRFRNLRRLYLEGQSNGIEAISDLPRLEDLTLRSITVDTLGFVRHLKHLWSLDIKLGGTANLSALRGMTCLKYLELWQIRGLKDISVISSLVGLQYLFLQSLPHITQLPNMSRLEALRRVHLDNMKGLKNLDASRTAPAIEDVLVIAANGKEPSQFQGVLGSPTLKEIVMGFGSKKKNDAFAALARAAGKREHSRAGLKVA